MLTLNIKSKRTCYGNWIMYFSVLLSYSNIIVSSACEFNNDTKLPLNWPCQWNSGEIPFVFDFFTLSPKRMMSLVRKAHTYIEARSCLVFKEQNPVESARKENFTYLFYSYSEVLESCCLPFFTKAVGRRVVLITPLCALPPEVAHATLHGLGMNHKRSDTFSYWQAKAVLFPYHCDDDENKMDHFNKIAI